MKSFKTEIDSISLLVYYENKCILCLHWGWALLFSSQQKLKVIDKVGRLDWIEFIIKTARLV